MMRLAALISALALLFASPAFAEMEKPLSSDPAVEDTGSPEAMQDTDGQPAEPGKVESSDPHPDE